MDIYFINEEVTIFVHVLIASVPTGIIGYERERIDKPAGIRTNMLVGGAVTLLVSQGKTIVEFFEKSGIDTMSADPIRIIHAIIVGISFIGAGMVLQIENEYRVKYLTTAATILFSTGVGIAVALHQYILAVGVTLLILFVNSVIALIGVQIKKKKTD